MGVLNFYFLVAGLACVCGFLLASKALPPNRWVGLRTARTLADSATWYRAHRILGCVLVTLGLLIALLTFWADTPVHPIFGLVTVLVVAAAFGFVYFRYAA